MRTLHYYDQVGLLVSYRRGNDYREYHQNHLIKLQQILIYRELDFSIREIKELLNTENFDLFHALEAQKGMLLERQTNTQSMIKNIEATMNTLKSQRNREIIFEGIPKEKVERWGKRITETAGEEALEKWYKTLEKLSEDEIIAHRKQGKALHEEYEKNLDLPIDSKKVQTLIKQHYMALNRYLYRTQENFQGIGCKGFIVFANKYTQDEIRESDILNTSNEMNEHFSTAMIYFAEHELKDNIDEYRKMGSDVESIWT